MPGSVVRHVLRAVVFAAMAWVATLVVPTAAGATPPAAPDAAAWVQNHRPTTVWAGVDGSRALAPARQWTYFRVAGPQVKMRIPVVDDRLGTTGWVDALDLGPSGPPPSAPAAPAPVALRTPAVSPATAPPAPAPPPPVPPPAAPAEPPPSQPSATASRASPPAVVSTERWVQTHRATPLWTEPAGGEVAGQLPQWTYLRQSGPSRGARIPVFEPASQTDGWIEGADVGPSGPPPPAPPPAPPVVAPRPDVPTTGLASLQVAPPRPRAVGAGERWIDVDLASQRLRLVEGDRVVRMIPVTTGKAGYRTPAGTFRIFHRVEVDVMDSATLGVSRESAEGYLLKNVRYTQYFSDGGYALHANYWQPPSVFGQTATSHGCIGMSEADAAAVWSFASHGTVVHIH